MREGGRDAERMFYAEEKRQEDLNVALRALQHEVEGLQVRK